MVAYCDVRLAKEGVIGLRPRNLRGLDGGVNRAAASAANVALGTPLLISSQADAVPMEETLALGADDWMGSNADGTVLPEQTGPGFTSTSPPNGEVAGDAGRGGQLRSSKMGVVRLP